MDNVLSATSLVAVLSILIYQYIVLVSNGLILKLSKNLTILFPLVVVSSVVCKLISLTIGLVEPKYKDGPKSVISPVIFDRTIEVEAIVSPLFVISILKFLVSFGAIFEITIGDA